MLHALVACAALLHLPGLAHAQVSFSDPISLYGYDAPSEPADLNGDGLSDLVGSAGTSFGQNDQGGYIYRPSERSEGGLIGEPLVVADLDGDGDIDAVRTQLDGGLVVLLNDGAGRLEPATVLGQDPAVAVLTDLDSDGDIDVVARYSHGDTGTSSKARIAWFENAGAGGFQTEQLLSTLPVPEAPNTLAARLFAGDIDGDGDTDLIGGSFNPSVPTSVVVFEQASAGNFTSRVATPSEVVLLELDDVNGDGALDIVAGNPSELFVFVNDGTGGFDDVGESLYIAEEKLESVITGDLDGDGDSEVIFTDRANAFVGWLDLTGSPPVIRSSGVLLDEEPACSSVFNFLSRSARVFDREGDGDNDILAFLNPLTSGGTFRLLFFENLDGAGSFAPGRLAMPSLQSSWSEVVDADLDGDLDVVSLNLSDVPGRKVHWSEQIEDAEGVRFLPFTAPTDLPLFGPELPLQSFAWIGDVLGDEHPEVVFRTIDSSFVCAKPVGETTPSVLRVHSFDPVTRQFELAAIVPDDSPTVLESAFGHDLDRDGLTDLLVGKVFAFEGTGVSVQWARGLGGQSLADLEFLAKLPSPSGNATSNVVFLDLENDGQLEALFAADGVLWSVPLEAGVLADETQLVALASSDANQLRAVDVDGDGRTDILVTRLIGSNSETLRWHRNLGAAFSEEILVEETSGSFLSVIDFDNDGLQDLVVSRIAPVGSPLGFSLAFHRATAPGRFLPEENVLRLPKAFEQGPDSRPRVVADLDGDGDADLLSVTASSLSWQAQGVRRSPFTDLGGTIVGATTDPELAGSGHPEPGAPITLELAQAPPHSLTLLVLGEALPYGFSGKLSVITPLLGGALVPSPEVLVPSGVTDGQGTASWRLRIPEGSVVNDRLLAQVFVLDGLDVSVSNALLVRVAEPTPR